ncbi:ankyrin repeat-containing domain protein [Lactarius hengduanensis]|nr:ankyrin repeat-containing domain protein [Lactarius hengduanensis]
MLRTRGGNVPLQSFSRMRSCACYLILEQTQHSGSSFDETACTAADNGDYEATHLLLQYDADINSKNYVDRTPLYYASWRGHCRSRAAPIEHGADKRTRSIHQTPLYQASEVGKLEVVRLLLKHGADVHMRA